MCCSGLGWAVWCGGADLLGFYSALHLIYSRRFERMYRICHQGVVDHRRRIRNFRISITLAAPGDKPQDLNSQYRLRENVVS